MAKKFTKKPDARAKLLFFQSNHTLLFCCLVCRRFAMMVVVVLKAFVLATMMTLFVESISCFDHFPACQ